MPKKKKTKKKTLFTPQIKYIHDQQYFIKKLCHHSEVICGESWRKSNHFLLKKVNQHVLGGKRISGATWPAIRIYVKINSCYVQIRVKLIMI
jgi:hypothetical protein